MAKKLSICGATWMVLLLSVAPAVAGEDYFLLMFGAQQIPANPKYSHTWATFVRATWEGDGCCPAKPTLEVQTVSWLACTGVVRVGAVCPEPGRNFELHEIIRWCQNNDMRISLWGAYRVDRELYHRAVEQVALLNSGQVRYQPLDMLRPTDKVSNCIHAVGSISGGWRIRVGTPGWGETASFYVLKAFEPWICQPRVTHRWVGSSLGLDQNCIIYRDYQNPRSGFGSPVLRLLGSERNLHATMGPPAP